MFPRRDYRSPASKNRHLKILANFRNIFYYLFKVKLLAFFEESYALNVKQMTLKF